MLSESARLKYATLRADVQQLCEQSRQLCEQSRALCAEARRQHTLSPWPHPIVPAEESAPQQDDALLDKPIANPHDIAMETMKQIRDTLDALPLEWQIKIVKALTARTLLKAHEQVQQAKARPALTA